MLFGSITFLRLLALFISLLCSWAVILSAASFLFANVGLSAIISYSLPVLMFLYPLAITLIFLSLCGRFFGYDRTVFRWTTAFTLLAALLDFIAALPGSIFEAVGLSTFQKLAGSLMPFSSLGLGWICPALAGFAIGLIMHVKHLQYNTDCI